MFPEKERFFQQLQSKAATEFLSKACLFPRNGDRDLWYQICDIIAI